MNLEIVNRIWERAPEGYVFLPRQARPQNTWFEGGWIQKGPMRDVLETMHNEDGYDLYFSPLSFSGDRKNENVLTPITVLYADLDEADPRTISPRPTLAWETSPGMYQGVWFTNELMTVEYFMDMNRRLTYAVGADKGGWHPSKVLRIPGSINWKRGGVEGRVLWDSGAPVSVRILDRMLPPVEYAGQPLESFRPDIPTKEEARTIRATLQPSLRYLLDTPPVNSRSEHIWRVAKTFAEQGISKEIAFQAIWWMPYNKFRLEGRPTRLWADIERAYFA